MQFVKFIASLTFCLLFLALSYGAPAGESSTSRCHSRKYSSEEESFIIDELRRYPGEFLPIWGLEMWNEIAKNHGKMLESNPIFPKRTCLGLRNYFQKTMLHSKGKVALPDDLKKRMPVSQKNKRSADDLGLTRSSEKEESQNSGVTGTQAAHQHDTQKIRFKYTPEEEEFMINFLKNYPKPRRAAFGKRMWCEAAEQLKELRQAYPFQFPYERTGGGLLSHFRRMAQIIVAKKQKKSMDEYKLLPRYSKAEDDFIFGEVLKPSCTSLYSVPAWEKIKAQHDIKVASHAPGFDQSRTATGLKNHFVKYLLAQKDRVPQAVKDKFSRNFSDTPGETSNTREAGNEDCSIWDLLEQGGAELHDDIDWEGEEEMGGEEESGKWDSMIEELLNTPGKFEFDSSKNQ